VIDVQGATSGSERRADGFAAHFLAPDDGLRYATQNAPVTAEGAVSLAFQFGMSLQAMLFRLHNLGLIAANERQRASTLGPAKLSFSANLREQYNASNRRASFQRPPQRLTDYAVAAYQAGTIGLGLLADLFGERNLARVKQMLESAGISEPLANHGDDIVDLL
jgi:hypothetical protein